MSNVSNDKPNQPGTQIEVRVEDAVLAAQELQRSGKLAEAESIYHAIREVFPDEPNTLHFLGILRHQQGRNDEALALIRRAADGLPGDSGPWVNLGNVLLEAQRFDDAVDAYKQASEISPDNILMYNNLGLLHSRRNFFDLAEAAYKHALTIAPNAEYVLHNYARLMQRQGRYEEAVAYGVKTLATNPNDPKARRVLCMSHALLGDMQAARDVVREWLAIDPDNPQAAHLLAAVGGSAAPARASDAYVAAEFDSFSKSFDAKLELLGYRAPELVADALTRAIAPATTAGDILDAGCGTGLCAPRLRPLAGRLDGVDLSEGMLDKARARGGYDSLTQAELTGYIAQHTAHWDAIVSADTLCYFGELAPVFSAVHAALRAGGWLVFSVEATESSNADDSGYHLNYHGRYAHTRSFVEACLRGAGLTPVSVESAVLRMEVLRPVQGLVVVARRT
jgi:predicted TPR repeat methyltransferase